LNVFAKNGLQVSVEGGPCEDGSRVQGD
jgi:hypothetical protein